MTQSVPVDRVIMVISPSNVRNFSSVVVPLYEGRAVEVKTRFF